MTELACKLEQLQLTSVARELDHLLADAAARNLSHAEAFEWLADVELEGRRARSIERRFRLSRLQSKIGIESFDFNHHKTRTQLKSKILRLLDLDFITQGTNVVIIGNPGTGKTFLAKILGWRACQANCRILFTTTMNMLNQLVASQVDHSLVRRLKTYTAPALLICD
jgi:DNA replication protein DnaC